MKYFDTENEVFLRAKKILDEADAVFVYTGAGMSAPSGAPTFRGDKGFWNAFPQYEALGMNFQMMANPRTFEDYLPLALGFYGFRLNLYKSLKPHSGYEALKRLFDMKQYGGYVVTSNVDGHTQKAGIENVLEEHGSINAWQCIDRLCSDRKGLVEAPKIVVDESTMRGEIEEEHFCSCGKALRPNILMFWDGRFCETTYRSQSAAYQKYKYGLMEKRNPVKVAVLEIGAGDEIDTMRVMANSTASSFETRVIRINLDEEKETHYNRAIHLQGDAEQIINALVPSEKEDLQAA
ncbi:SIR2 family NAD-dependent protein deacylase [Vibrio crassostreae]|uniref:SIR2 family NAD-dependent protein deacylase n=1 Tax=Vibrio crassostreae TaxID=246167 RepID=UPI001B30C018|nr:Sir2 family NAD-dependent protein deacetylase [Vibrio crassostreae]